MNGQNRDHEGRRFLRRNRPFGGGGGQDRRPWHQRHGPGRGGSQGGSQQRPRLDTLQRTEAERQFLEKVPLTPTQWIELEKGSSEPAMRALDLLSPIGKGTRGLIVSPPKAGKTTILKQLCQAVAKSDPSIQVHCLLVDERPEEVTDIRRSVTAEVHASSSDRAYGDHIRVADEVYQKAVGEAAGGKDVMIVVDSLTRLSRVHNTAAPGTRTMTGGLDARAMETPRRFFGAARKLEEGGSLTILATILVDTGSRMDDIIFQEFKGTGNMEVVLSRPAAEVRLFPAIHVKNSGTRREELLLGPKTLEAVWKLRRILAGMGDVEATRTLVELLRKHPTNEKLLAAIMGVP